MHEKLPHISVSDMIVFDYFKKIPSYAYKMVQTNRPVPENKNEA
jgi:hypothetical protein